MPGVVSVDPSDTVFLTKHTVPWNPSVKQQQQQKKNNLIPMVAGHSLGHKPFFLHISKLDMGKIFSVHFFS